jgi:hypothetical protein
VGVADPSDHILVATTPTELGGNTLSTIIVKKEPLTTEEVDAFVASVAEIPGSVVQYAPGGLGDPANTVSRVATGTDAEVSAFYDEYPYDVRPIDDDRPFFWHFTPFDDVIGDYTNSIDGVDWEDSVGERVLLLLLAVAVLFATVFLLLPFFAIRKTWTQLPRKGASAVYFLALGLGFMFFEITLIQRLTLFLGYPTYSLTVTLASILLFTGVGALIGGRTFARPQLVLPVIFAVLTVLTAFYLFVLPSMTDSFQGWSLAPRVVLTFVVLAPLGVCLGVFMPLGLGAVARLSHHHEREYVAWGWAVNGFASVIGAVLTTIVAMTFGFSTVLVLALLIYGVALLVLRRLLAAEPETTLSD